MVLSTGKCKVQEILFLGHMVWMIQKVRNIVENAMCGNMKLDFNISIYFALIESQNM